MEGEHEAAGYAAAVNGLPSPADGTSISPYGTRRYAAQLSDLLSLYVLRRQSGLLTMQCRQMCSPASVATVLTEC